MSSVSFSASASDARAVSSSVASALFAGGLGGGDGDATGSKFGTGARRTGFVGSLKSTVMKHRSGAG